MGLVFGSVILEPNHTCLVRGVVAAGADCDGSRAAVSRHRDVDPGLEVDQGVGVDAAVGHRVRERQGHRRAARPPAEHYDLGR